MGKETKQIAREMNVSIDYIEQLEKLFNEVEYEENIKLEDVMEKANKITQIYILENIPKKLSYIDVQILKEKALNKLSIDLLKNEFTKNTEENEYILN